MESTLQRAVRAAMWRLLPFLVLLYLVAFLDRVNVGFAALTMNADLKISATEFGFAASVFFVGYFFFEVPSNLALTRFGVPLWMGRIMITWGLASMAMAFVYDAKSLYILRFILGVAEAGFFPGILIYLTMWFPAGQRGGVFALFQAASPLSSAIGAPLSAIILTNLNGFGGLAGWKWLFLIEGFPSIVLGALCFWYLTPQPSKALWLAPDEREALQSQLDRERLAKEAVRKYSVLEGLINPRILMLAALFFLVILGANGTAFWVPQIIRSLGFSTMAVGWLTAAPSLCGAVAMIFWARHSDKTGERTWHLLIPLLVSSAGFFFTAMTLNNAVLAIVGISFATLGIYCAISIFWTWPTAVVTGTAAAVAVALINSVANLSGLVGPWAIGLSRDLTGGFAAAMIGWGISFLLAACLGAAISRGAKALGPG